LRCLTAAAGGALSEGGAAAARELLGRFITNVSTSGTVARGSAERRSGLTDVTNGLRGTPVAIPDNVRDGLGNAFGTGFAASAAAFPGRAAPCITETAYPQLQSTPTVLRCLVTAAGGALSEGGAATARQLLGDFIRNVSASGTVAR